MKTFNAIPGNNESLKDWWKEVDGMKTEGRYHIRNQPLHRKLVNINNVENLNLWLASGKNDYIGEAGMENKLHKQ